MNIKQLGLFKQKVLDGSIELCKGNVTPKEIFQLANNALEEALIIDSVSTDTGLVNPNNCPYRSNGFCTA